MPRIEIAVAPESFKFLSQSDWTANAPRLFSRFGLTSASAICVDAVGRICVTGKEFERAEIEHTYPVRVYGIPAWVERTRPNLPEPTGVTP